MNTTQATARKVCAVCGAVAVAALGACGSSDHSYEDFLKERVSLTGLTIASWDWRGHIGFAWRGSSVVTLDSEQQAILQAKPSEFAILWTDIALSPDATAVAYSALYSHDDRYRITLQSTDGSQPRKLPGRPEHLESPTFPPDGGELFFIASGAFSSRLLRSSLDGEGATEVSSVDIYGRISWHPSGEYFAFPHDRNERGIYRLQRNGTGLRPIINAEPGEWLYSPSFSPDGQRIAYVARRGPNDAHPPIDPPHHFRIYTIRSDGTDRRLVTDLLDPLYYDDVYVTWSPYGNQLVYNFYDSAEIPKPKGSQIYLIDTDGSHVQLVTSVQAAGGSVGAPHWVR